MAHDLPRRAWHRNRVVLYAGILVGGLLLIVGAVYFM